MAASMLGALVVVLVVHPSVAVAGQQPVPWWHSAWTKRVVATVNTTGVATTLTDFPLLLVLNPSRIDYGSAGPGGRDLRVLAGDHSTVLPHEVEQWVPGGTSYVWVRVPVVAGGGALTRIWLYYGNQAAGDGQNAAAVWNRYRGVWHLTGMGDATGRGLTAMNQGSSDQAGRIGRARRFDGVNDRMEIAQTSSLRFAANDSFTLSAWVHAETLRSRWQGIVTKSRERAPWYGLWVSSTRRWVAGGPANLTADQAATGWTHLAVVQDGAAGQRRLYVNGRLRTTRPAQHGTGTGNLVLGGASGTTEFFQGAIDEVRVSDIARSADWISALHRSESDTLVTYGSDGPLPPPNAAGPPVGDDPPPSEAPPPTPPPSEAPPLTAQPEVFQTLRDTIPNFARRPTIATRQSGPWSSPATWTPSRIPGAGDVVLIQGPHSVTYDRASAAPLAAVGIAGALRFRTDVNTRLTVGTLLVQPGGSLVVGTREAPVRPDVLAEIVIADRPLHTIGADPDTGAVDPQQYGTGLIALGTVAIHGHAKSPTWMRLAAPPAAGARVLQLHEPVVGWRPGDSIVIPDTRHLPIESPLSLDMIAHYETEVARIGAVSAGGRQITLAQPLQFGHQGAVNPDGTPAMGPAGEPLVPHAANLTRNVRIRSENPAGTRGHVMFTHQARVDVHNAQWIDLGRTTIDDLNSTKLDSSGRVIRIGTNQMARYWVHFHFLIGPARPSMPRSLPPAQMRAWLEQHGWQYEFSGNAIATSTAASHPFKWGIDVHASHYGKVTDNVIYNLAGSGLQTEDGSESYNLLARNFVATVRGIGEMLPPVPNHDPDHTLNHGRDGSGFWYRGPHNWMEENVAADVTYAGHYLSRYYLVASRDIPRFPGAVANADRTYMKVMPVLSFAGNEAYGPMESGLYGAWVSGFGDALNWPEIRIDRFTAWHPYSKQIEWYHNGKTTFRDLVLRGDPFVTSGVSLRGADIRTVGMRLPHYENVDLTVEGADIRGLPKGIDLPTRTMTGITRIRNSFLENYVNLSLLTKITYTRTEIFNVRFGTFGAGQKRLNGFYNEHEMRTYAAPLHISLERDARKVNAGAAYDVRVFRYNGLIGDDFRLFDTSDPAPCRTKRSSIAAYVCR